MGYKLKNIIRTDALKQNGECPINIRITYGRKYIRHSINENINPIHWNSEDGIPKKNCPNKEIISSKLYTESTRINDLINHFYFTNNKTFPSLDQLKKILGKKIQSEDSKSIFDYYKEFMSDYQKKKGLKDSTMKSYRALELRLLDYYKDASIVPTWEGFNHDFYDDFVNYYIDRNYTEGSIGRLIKNLKTFLGYISLNYKLVNSEQISHFKVLKEEPDFVTLSKQDLLMIKYHLGLVPIDQGHWHDEHEVVLTKREKLILKILLFLCFTGVSYVDFQKLTYLDIENNMDLETEETLSFTYARQKTNLALKVVITLTDDLIELLITELHQYSKTLTHKLRKANALYFMSTQEKIELFKKAIKNLNQEDIESHFNLPKMAKVEKMPHYPSLFPNVLNQEFNREVKNVLLKIGLTEEVKVYEKKNRKNDPVKYKKYELVTSVTGRRTFITQSLQDGISMQHLMRATGHKDVRSLMRYEKMDTNVINKEFIDKKKKLVPNENWEKRKVRSLKNKPLPPQY